MSHDIPYSVGSEIVLESRDKQSIRATILEIKATTLSCVMVVQLSSCTDLRILKLYDRRTAEQLRTDEGNDPWNMQIESCYRRYLDTAPHMARSKRWLEKSRNDPWWDAGDDDEEDCEQWDLDVMEAYAQFQCLKMYATETRAYERMYDLQGVHVPILFDRVVLRDSDSKSSSDYDIYLDCPGIILQYIRGIHLTDIAEHLPRSEWQLVCDSAIHILHKIGDRGICNRDVRTRSFIVAKDLDDTTWQVFMIDFGICVFREQPHESEPALSDHDFRSWQAREQEEGAIGHVMEKRLEGVYKYQLSSRAASLAYEFMREGLSD